MSDRVPDAARHGSWLRLARYRLRHFTVNQDVAGGWRLLILAALIGVAAGTAVVAFYGAVDLLDAGVRSLADRVPTGSGVVWIPLVVLPVALFLARLLRPASDPDQSGTMIPQLILSAAGRGGDLPAEGVGRKLLAAVVTLGAGGSLGSEGAIALAGGTVGSVAGRYFHFRPGRVKVLLACGAAAGISAAFHAPIAGVMFALEIVLGNFAVVALTPVIVASVLGAVTSRIFFGQTPAFHVSTDFTLDSALQLAPYALLGVCTGLLAVVFVHGFFKVLDVFERLPVHRFAAPLLAGLLVAGGGLLFPPLLGPGRDGIQMVLFGELAGMAALTVGLLKIATAGLTAAGGGAGGVFTPSIFVGAGFGSAFGLAVQNLFPGLAVDPGAFAAVGMAGLLAGSTAAPLTAILIVFEMTGDYGLILPLMLVCVLSYLTADRVSGESLYSLSLERRGEKIRHGVDLAVLSSVQVSECYDRDPVTLSEDTPFREIVRELRDSGQLDFPVVTGEGRLVGVISYQELTRALAERDIVELLVAADLMMEQPEKVEPGDSLLVAMQRMSTRDLDFIPVVEPGTEDQLAGLLRRADVMETYQAHLTAAA